MKTQSRPSVDNKATEQDCSVEVFSFKGLDTQILQKQMPTGIQLPGASTKGLKLIDWLVD